MKDIALDNDPMPVRTRSVHDDPAVIGVSDSAKFVRCISLHDEANTDVNGL